MTSCQVAHSNDAAEKVQQKELEGSDVKTIRVGMAPQEVHTVLGMPNIATKDAYGKDAWIYDRCAVDIGFEPEGDGFWVLSQKKRENEANLNDLTIVIKFSDLELVDDVTYHPFEY